MIGKPLARFKPVGIVRLALVLAIAMATALSACGSSTTEESGISATPSIDEPTEGTPEPTPTVEGPLVHLDPVYHPDGNRIVDGSGLRNGFIQNITTKDVNLDGTPTWITGASTSDGDVWAVAFDDGTVVGYLVPYDGPPTMIDIPGDQLDPDQPPVLTVQDNTVRLATTPFNASPYSVPLYLSGNRTVYVDNSQRLTVLEPDNTLWRPDLEVLPDSRLVQISPEKVLVLAGPTDRYPHSALGDLLEATEAVVVTVRVNEVNPIYRSGDYVIESIAPLLADIDGDGVDDVILTISSADETLIVAASSTGGGVIATSEPSDRRLDWRHLIAVGSLGPNGSREIVEVRYPSTGQGTVRFLRLDGDLLGSTAELSRFRSHEFGSRNLEMALAADVDRDGQIEVIVPAHDGQSIAGIQRNDQGATEVWRRALDGTLATNLAVLTRPDGTLSLAAATQEGSLRIWQ